MAIDPQAEPETERASAIENEIPAYRAISPMAVVSLLLGLVAALSFADLGFVAAGVLAVVTGLVADRAIRRMPDVLTGRGLAQAGVALGLVFGLSAVTMSLVSQILLHRQAVAFARKVTEAFQARDMAQISYYKTPRSLRADKTPAEVYAKLKEETKDPMIHDAEFGAIDQIMERLKTKGNHIRFVEVEAVAFDGLTPMAAAVLELHGPPPQGRPPQEFILLELKGEGSGRSTNWYVSQFQYPYQLRSYVPPIKPVDDGHGHGHSH